MPNKINDRFHPLLAVVADQQGQIFELDGYAALGMTGSDFHLLTVKNTIKMPFGGELMFLPDRAPVVYNLHTQEIEVLAGNPYQPDEFIYPVAAFNSPGYVNAYTSAYQEHAGATLLPLFSYGAVGWGKDAFRSPLIQVDKEKRQDLRLMPQTKILQGVKRIQRKMPHNRLRQHLEKCALQYGCPAAKNFYLKRFEAPLPTSRSCNADCLGCISYQNRSAISCCQERIAFTPTPEEITDIALEHIPAVKKAVVSFGQGCEGDPLLADHVIEPAVKMIRKQTVAGTININTNAGRPEVLQQLMESGVDSVRISLNSFQKACYQAYYRPKSYEFKDVVESFRIAASLGKFISINYLNCPGFNDSEEEFEAMVAFLEKHPVDLIQWRNLNYDPLAYYQTMAGIVGPGRPMGMFKILKELKHRFPNLRYGYFNPPKESFAK